MSGRTGFDPPTDRQIHKLSKELLVNGADHEDVGRVRTMLATWKDGSRQVSWWITALEDPDPVVAGEAAMDVCRKADRHHYSTLNRGRKVNAA